MSLQQSLHVHMRVQHRCYATFWFLPISYFLPNLHVGGRTKRILWIISKTRIPVVTGRKVISFLSIFGSRFLSHQKILSVTTKDTAELNLKHVKLNVITTQSIKMTFQQSLNKLRTFTYLTPNNHLYAVLDNTIPGQTTQDRIFIPRRESQVPLHSGPHLCEATICICC